jgi:histidinol dehydrogenase
MGAIPARVAGVREVILCSPPTSNGIPSAAVLAAADIARVDRVFSIGGAGAIAALAFGTESVPRVDRIVGPGNAYVAEAKLQVAGVCGIDSPAGPSELLVIVDDSVSADVIALEILAQAEHDPMASVVIVSIGSVMSAKILDRVSALIGQAPRREIIEESLGGRGALLITDSIADAVTFANAFAPEHLLLAVDNPAEVAASCRNAGTIFLGPASSVAFGDYMTGANHVLPTGGLARSYSGLSVLDFLRWTTVQTVNSSVAGMLAEDVGNFADAEGLHSHAATARQWAGAAR